MCTTHPRITNARGSGGALPVAGASRSTSTCRDFATLRRSRARVRLAEGAAKVPCAQISHRIINPTKARRMCAIQGTGGRRAPPAAPARTSRGSARANFVSPRVCRRVKNRSWPIVRSARNFVPPFQERGARAGKSDGGSVVPGTVPRPLFFCLRVRCRGQGEGVRRILTLMSAFF